MKAPFARLRSERRARNARFIISPGDSWRRSAVTFMHGAGCLPGQVARWVGHSVQIGEKHYLGDVRRNGLVFEPGGGVTAGRAETKLLSARSRKAEKR